MLRAIPLRKSRYPQLRLPAYIFLVHLTEGSFLIFLLFSFLLSTKVTLLKSATKLTFQLVCVIMQKLRFQLLHMTTWTESKNGYQSCAF